MSRLISTMPRGHCIYGLRLHADVPIPGLAITELTHKIDVMVWLQSMPTWVEEGLNTERTVWYSSPYQDERETSTLRVWKIADGNLFHLVYADATEFIINNSGTKIWGRWTEELTLEDAATYLLGPIMGFVLMLRGVTCLHASAIAIDNKAIALLGPQSAGKSTTAATFAHLGYPVLTDDVVALADFGSSFLVQPGYPRVRLWPDSVNAIYGANDALPLLTPNWDKRYLDLTIQHYRFQQRPLPLAAVYILGERSEDPSAPFVRKVSANAGMMSLIANTYATYLKDKAKRAQEFEFLNRLVSVVPLRQVTPHANATYLPKLCDTILDDYMAFD